jgi:hypothetical protein
MIDERPTKIIATAPGELDIVVPLTDEEWIEYKQREEESKNKDRRETLSGKILVSYLRSLFKGRPIKERVLLLGGEVCNLLNVIESDSSISNQEYTELKQFLRSEMIGKIDMIQIDLISTLTDKFIEQYKLEDSTNV